MERRGDSKGATEVRREEHRGGGLAGNWRLAISGMKMPVSFCSFCSVFEPMMNLSPSQTGALVCLCYCSSQTRSSLSVKGTRMTQMGDAERPPPWELLVAASTRGRASEQALRSRTCKGPWAASWDSGLT